MVLRNYLDPHSYIPGNWDVKEWSSHKRVGYVSRLMNEDGRIVYVWRSGERTIKKSFSWEEIKKLAEAGE